jgi:alanine-synthesizing transaminase
VQNQSCNNISFEFNSAWQAPVLSAFQAIKKQAHEEISGIFDLSMINPDIAPARILMDKLVEASLKKGQHRYAVARGTNALRKAFAEKYSVAFQVELNPESEICVCMGSKDATLQTLHAVKGDRSVALIARPAYPAHEAALNMTGYEVHSFNQGDDENETLANLIKAIDTYNPNVVLLNYPNNPTGQMVSSNFWSELGKYLLNKNTLVINDFVYGEMGYELKASSALSSNILKNKAVEIYSLSKAYSVPGWRVGALVGNSKVVQAVSHRKSYVDYGIFLPIQHASAYALSGKDVKASEVVNVYKKRADILVKGLQSLGWGVVMPQAGCSVWAKVPDSMPSVGLDIAVELIQKKVIAMPGVVFGKDYGKWIRFALVEDEQNLRKIIDLLK